jgi:hypothetical protein
VGKEVLVSLRYRGRAPEEARLRVPGEGDGWRVDGGYLFPSAGQIVWQVVPPAQWRGSVVIETPRGELTKSLVAGGARPVPLSPRRTDGRRVLSGFLHPREPLLPAGAEVAEIALDYTPRRAPGTPWYTHWALWFFGLTLASGLGWSRVFGVRL